MIINCCNYHIDWNCFWSAIAALATFALVWGAYFINCCIYHNDCNCFWTAIAALATIALVWVAWVQLRSMNKISMTNFAIEIRKQFFTKEARDLFMLFEFELIDFKDPIELKNKEPKYFRYFELQEDKKRFVNEDNKQTIDFIHKTLGAYGKLKEGDIDDHGTSKYYSSHEIDELILKPFEDLGLLYSTGKINSKIIYEEFSYYLIIIGKNKQIKEYIKHIREEDDEEKKKNKHIRDKEKKPLFDDSKFYSGFEALYNKYNQDNDKLI